MRLHFSFCAGTATVVAILALILPGCGSPVLVDLTPIPATITMPVTLSAAAGSSFPRGGTAVSFFIVLDDGVNTLGIDEDRAEPWLVQLAQDPPRFRSQRTTGSPDTQGWSQGTPGEYIVSARETVVSADGNELTVPSPVLKGLRQPVTLQVRVLNTQGEPERATYAPPPRIDTITRYGLVNGVPVPVDEDIPGGDPTTPQATTVPSQVPTPVAVDGWNIDAGTKYAWVLEGEGIPGGALQNGRFAYSPMLDTGGSPARLGLRVTNADGQSDFLDLALLALEPPMLQRVVRSDAIGQNLPYSAQQTPANGNALLQLCGLRFNAPACEYVSFSTEDGVEAGRYFVPEAGLEGDCIRNVKPPVLAHQTEPSILIVTAYFADGSYTQTEAVPGVNVLEVVPPPRIETALPLAVPATQTIDDGNNLITLAGDYIHPSSKVQVRWAFTAIGEEEGPFGEEVTDNQHDAVLGGNADLDSEGYIPNSAITFGDNRMTFVRPVLDTGLGSRSQPVSTAKGRTDRISEDREVSFVVVDAWGQRSDGEAPTVTYTAPPVIYAFNVTNRIGTGAATPATRTEEFLVTGINWAEGAAIRFQRQDNGQVILPTAPITGFDLVDGVQTYLSGVPTIANPPADGSGIPVWAFVSNPDGQEAVASILYLAPNATPLTVVNDDTGFPEVGALAASTRSGAPSGGDIFGRTLRIGGFAVTPSAIATVEILTATGSPIGNTIVRPEVIASGNDVLVEAPVLAGITEDTLAFVRVTDTNGQTTPASLYGVFIYKPAPSAARINIPGSTPPNTMPATFIYAAEASPDLEDDGNGVTPALDKIPAGFVVTGSHLASARPFIQQQGGYVLFEGYAGDIPPGQNGFAGYVSSLAAVSFEESGAAFGTTPALPAVEVEQTATVVYFDKYGQETTIAANDITIVPPAVVEAFRGVFTDNTGATATIELLTPGRDAAGTPMFSILGKNLGRVDQVRFRFTGTDAGFIGGWETATPQGTPATSVTGPITQATPEQLPFTTVVEAYVRTVDGQVTVVQNIEYTAPPVIVGFVDDVNQFLANTSAGTAQPITLLGLNLVDSKAPVDAFTIAGQELALVPVRAGINPASPHYDAPVEAVFEISSSNTTGIATSLLGPIPFTYTSRTGQVNSAILSGVNPGNVAALLGEDLSLHAYRGPVRRGGSDGGVAQAAKGVFGSDSFESVVTVSFGQYNDIEQTGADVNTMRIDLVRGSSTARQLSTSGLGMQTLLVQDSRSAAPALPQFFGSARGGNETTFLVTGHFVGNDDFRDVAVGIPDGGATSAITNGAVYLFAGSALGLATVDAGNPIKLTLPAANTPRATDEFGFSLAAGNVIPNGNDDLVVGAPGRTVNGTLERGEVFVFEGGSIMPGVAPVQTLGYPTGYAHAAVADRLGETLVVGNLDAASAASEVLAGTPLQRQLVDVTAGVSISPFRTAPGSGLYGIIGTYDTGENRLLVPLGGSVLAFAWAAAGEQPLSNATEYVIPGGAADAPASIAVESNARLAAATGNVAVLVRDENGQFSLEERDTLGDTTQVLVAPSLVGPAEGATALPAYVVVAPNEAWSILPRSD
ncbi:hypothetical protein [Roseovarius pacificus]|uniref:hypothetical protein n=1 Tax=Roseovarius pacificus TaxID=337701 RepID=UPI002A18C078|nr:hypothetical protein [Roseovarius pacificus]